MRSILGAAITKPIRTSPIMLAVRAALNMSYILVRKKIAKFVPRPKMGGGNPNICLGIQHGARKHLWGPWHKAKEWTPDGDGKMSTRRICKRKMCGTLEYKVSKKEMREYMQSLRNQGMK